MFSPRELKSGEFTPRSVLVAVMEVGIVRMAVAQALVPVSVRMRLGRIPGRVRMLMVLVVHVLMRMRDRVMDVLVLISNCPQLNNPCNAYNPTPVRVMVWGPD